MEGSQFWIDFGIAVFVVAAVLIASQARRVASNKIPVKNAVSGDDGRSRMCLLFTSHCSPQRREMHTKVIRFYLEEGWAPNQLFLVDSANQGVDCLPVGQQLLFDQNTACPRREGSTDLEMCSMIKACRAFQDKMLGFDHVLKLTCKYTLPDLRWVDIGDADYVIQHFNRGRTSRGQFNRPSLNTELFGCRPALLVDLMNQLSLVSPSRIMEKKLWIVMLKQSATHKIAKLPALRNTSTFSRGDGSTLIKI